MEGLSNPCHVNKLPFDILRETFILCLPRGLYHSRPDALDAPLLLCHVCHAWRIAALEMPRLWYRLVLPSYPREPIGTNMRSFFEATTHWFKHSSRHLPFYFQVDWDFTSADFPPEEFDERVVFSLPSNLRELVMRVDNEGQLYAWFPPSGNMDLLESVSLEIHEQAPHLPRMPHLILRPAANFHMLRLRLPSFRLDNLSRFHVPWDQMTHLCIQEEVSLQAWHDIIRACPLLQKCCVELFIDASEEGEIDDDEDAAELLPPVTLDRLQDLGVAFLTPASPTVFTGLTCPSLISLLVVSESVHLGFPPTAQPLHFYRQTAAHLRVLILQQQQIHVNDVLRLLRITPLLVGLILECEGDHDELLNALMVPMPGKGDEAPILVPHLRLFKLSIITFQRAEANLPTFSAPPYVEAIRSRWLRDHESTMGRSLPRGSWTFRPTLTVDEHHEHVLQQVKMSLEPFQAQGLDVETLVKRGSALGRVELPGRAAWSMWRDEVGLPSMLA